RPRAVPGAGARPSHPPGRGAGTTGGAVLARPDSRGRGDALLPRPGHRRDPVRPDRTPGAGVTTWVPRSSTGRRFPARTVPMLEPEEVRPARALGWRLLAGVAWGAAALILADVLRWMWIGPVPLLLLGRFLPPGPDLEAEVALGAIAATVALVAAGGIRR